jgi:Tetracyclin repressor-like, C-terminal domain
MGDRTTGITRVDGTGGHALRGCDRWEPASAGFSIDNAAHTFWLLDSYVYGHVGQETSLPFSSSEEMAETGGSPIEQAGMAGYPHLLEMAMHARGFDYGVDGEFDFGLELILEALAELTDFTT